MYYLITVMAIIKSALNYVQCLSYYGVIKSRVLEAQPGTLLPFCVSSLVGATAEPANAREA
jgi:hypothetical protein